MKIKLKSIKYYQLLRMYTEHKPRNLSKKSPKHFMMSTSGFYYFLLELRI